MTYEEKIAYLTRMHRELLVDECEGEDCEYCWLLSRLKIAREGLKRVYDKMDEGIAFDIAEDTLKRMEEEE